MLHGPRPDRRSSGGRSKAPRRWLPATARPRPRPSGPRHRGFRPPRVRRQRSRSSPVPEARARRLDRQGAPAGGLQGGGGRAVGSPGSSRAASARAATRRRGWCGAARARPAALALRWPRDPQARRARASRAHAGWQAVAPRPRREIRSRCPTADATPEGRSGGGREADR